MTLGCRLFGHDFRTITSDTDTSGGTTSITRTITPSLYCRHCGTLRPDAHKFQKPKKVKQ